MIDLSLKLHENLFCGYLAVARADGRMGEHCYEMKCITRVSSKLNPQLIVGKYGTSSIWSERMIRENLTRF